MPTAKQILVKNLKRLLKDVNQAEIARKMNVPRNYITRWKTGQHFPLMHMESLAKALGVKSSDLFKR